MTARITALITAIGLALALAPTAGATGLVNLPYINCYHYSDPACTDPYATPNGGTTANTAVMTADGMHLYVGGRDVVYHFLRDPLTGALTLHDCIDEEPSGAGLGDPWDCTPHFPGNQPAMGLPIAMALSPDAQQKDLYIAAHDGSVNGRSVIHLHRDPTTGALSFGECLAALAGSTCSSFGTSSDSRAIMTGLAVSPDGQSVVATSSTFGAELLNFDRNPTTGVLTLHQCFTYNSTDTSCTILTTPPNQGNPNDFDGVAVSPDNQDVYTTLGLSGNGAVAHFTRTPSGALTYRNCIGNTSSGCGTTVAGDAFGSAGSVAVSPDGEVYTTAGDGSGASAAIVHLRRVLTAGPTHGDLSFGNCLSWAGNGCGAWLSGAPGGDTPLYFAGFTSDGQGFYATALGYDISNVQVSSGVLHFSRDTSSTSTHGDVVAVTSCFAADNSLNTYTACAHPPSSFTATNLSADSAALSPDNNQLYVPTGATPFGTGGQWGGLLQLGVAAPTATTGGASSVTQTSAVLNGSSNPDGSATTYHFDYGTTAGYGTSVPVPDGAVGSDSTVHAEAQTITGLIAGTTYHFRIVATNSGGTTYGSDQTFSTQMPPAVAPTATSGSASSVTQTTAQLNGSSNPDGSATTYHFDYGMSTAYGTSAPVPDGAVGSDGAVHAETQTITGLTPRTTYHFRIVAVNAGGITDGADQTFTTLAPNSQAPQLSGLTVDPPRFFAAGHDATTSRHATKHHHVGTAIAYTDSTSATTTFTVLRKVAGIQRGRSCVAMRGRVPKHPHRCTRLVRVGSFHHLDRAGRNRLHFSGRLRGAKLAPGAYVLRAQATSPAGSSGVLLAPFTILD